LISYKPQEYFLSPSSLHPRMPALSSFTTTYNACDIGSLLWVTYHSFSIIFARFLHVIMGTCGLLIVTEVYYSQFIYPFLWIGTLKAFLGLWLLRIVLLWALSCKTSWGIFGLCIGPSVSHKHSTTWSISLVLLFCEASLIITITWMAWNS
jgi:hypothetical protein